MLILIISQHLYYLVEQSSSIYTDDIAAV